MTKTATELGITVLYVTHDRVEAVVVADRIAVMAHGEILQIGNPFELYRSPANALVAEFFGSINWLRGKMLDDNHVETECGVLCVADSRRCVRAVIVRIPPQDLRLEPSSNEDDNQIRGIC